MKQTIVVDSNIVNKWFLRQNETELEQSYDVYRKIKNGLIKAWAPSFLLIEVSNILLYKKQFSEKAVDQIIEKIQNSGISFVEFNVIYLKELVRLSKLHDLTTYDGLYLLLALQKNCQLVTADKKLLNVKEVGVSLGSL